MERQEGFEGNGSVWKGRYGISHGVQVFTCAFDEHGLHWNQVRSLLSRVQLENGAAHETPPPATIFAMFPLPPDMCISEPATEIDVLHALREVENCNTEEIIAYDWRKCS